VGRVRPELMPSNPPSGSVHGLKRLALQNLSPI
jgi:hypothetical protein